MKNVVSILLVIGLMAAGWMNRDKLRGLVGSSSTVEEIPTSTPEPEPTIHYDTPPAVTPNPARESQAQAMSIYKALKIPDSPLNKKFVALYADARRNNPGMLARPDWPMKLAERAMVELGGAPLPVPTAPPHASGSMPGNSALDRTPNPWGRTPKPVPIPVN